MAALVSATSAHFQRALTPLAPFDGSYFPALSALDFLGALRLSVVLRQIRVLKGGLGGEPRGTFVHDLWTTLVIVFGGEIIACALLTATPSFMISPTVTLLFVASHVAAQVLPFVPPMNITTELPLAILDAATRTLLVCDFSVALTKSSANPLVRQSPFALLITSTVLGNGGFAFVNGFSMLDVDGWKLSVIPELKPWGWTTMDLWIAPLATAIYATLSHQQPFWAEVQTFLVGLAHDRGYAETAWVKFAAGPKPIPEIDAKAVVFLILATGFSLRAVKNFLPKAEQQKAKAAVVKAKNQAVTKVKELPKKVPTIELPPPKTKVEQSASPPPPNPSPLTKSTRGSKRKVSAKQEL